MNLFETVADELHLNMSIEQILDDEEPQFRVLFRDGLDLINQAGEQGIRIDEWDARMQSLHPEFTHEDIQTIHRDMMDKFDFLVWFDQDTDMNYWQVRSRAKEDQPEDNSPIAQMAQHQIRLVGRIHHFMKNRPMFTIDEVVNFISDELPRPMAELFVQHVIDSTGGSIKSIGGGEYKWDNGPAKPSAADHINNLKNGN